MSKCTQARTTRTHALGEREGARVRARVCQCVCERGTHTHRQSLDRGTLPHTTLVSTAVSTAVARPALQHCHAHHVGAYSSPRHGLWLTLRACSLFVLILKIDKQLLDRCCNTATHTTLVPTADQGRAIRSTPQHSECNCKVAAVCVNSLESSNTCCCGCNVLCQYCHAVDWRHGI